MADIVGTNVLLLIQSLYRPRALCVAIATRPSLWGLWTHCLSCFQQSDSRPALGLLPSPTLCGNYLNLNFNQDSRWEQKINFQVFTTDSQQNLTDRKNILGRWSFGFFSVNGTKLEFHWIVHISIQVSWSFWMKKLLILKRTQRYFRLDSKVPHHLNHFLGKTAL